MRAVNNTVEIVKVEASCCLWCLLVVFMVGLLFILHVIFVFGVWS